MNKESKESTATTVVAALLAVYFLLSVLVASSLLLSTFPTTEFSAEKVTTAGDNGTKKTEWADLSRLEFGDGKVLGWVVFKAPAAERGLVLLAFLAGILDSFLHCAQSLGAFIGDHRFGRSWGLWYVLRLPVGAVLAVLVYFVLRAGLMTANDASISVYGVVAFGGLAGWFSKRATDKLAEVFETAFATRKPAEFTGKLDTAESTITKVEPESVAAGPGDVVLTVTGTGFVKDAKVRLGTVDLAVKFINANTLEATLAAADRPAAGEHELTVINPQPYAKPSKPYKVEFK